jgi:membrane protein DedA with SNARE-associated domain
MWFSFERSGAGSISTGDCGHHGNFRDMNASTSVELSFQRGTWNLCVVSRPTRVVQTAARLADRHYVWMILLYRYPHGIRGVPGFAYGISHLPWPTFLVLNFAAAGLWSCATVSVGYAFGEVSEKVMSDASSGLGLVMLVAFLGVSWILSKKLERVVERA